ncbi:hypothetical protein B0G81_6783 [Paraburkholderia sp. BL6665CI2N2]|nr:hypothetical protein B0G81_6783 [Paraburkholderia sp. BL6665CI2N2]
MQTTAVETSNTATITNIRTRHRGTADKPAKVIELPPTGDVIASIRIELRRGGKVSYQMDGVTHSNAYRLTSALLRAVAETFQMMRKSG